MLIALTVCSVQGQETEAREDVLLFGHSGLEVLGGRRISGGSIWQAHLLSEFPLEVHQAFKPFVSLEWTYTDHQACRPAAASCL